MIRFPFLFRSLIATLLTALASHCLAAELKLHYTFDEGAGITAASVINQNTNNTLNLIGASAWAPGMPGFGNALEITGVSGRAEAVDPISWSAQTITGSSTGSISMAVWINLSSFPATGVPTLMGSVSSQALAYHHQMLIRMDGSSAAPPADKANAWGQTFGSGASVATSRTEAAAQITTGEWIHYAVTFDSTTKTCILYMNGKPVSTATDAAWTGYWNASDLVRSIVGSDNNNSVRGLYDDARIYSGVLTPAEVLALIPDPPVVALVNSFSATPGSFTQGETVTLSWDVSDADSVTIDQGIGPVASTGTLELTPDTTTTWTLTAIRSGNPVTATATATQTLGPIDVFILGGQSNMQGTAISSKLPTELLSIPEIQLYAAGTAVSGAIANKWVTLRPANGATFGPEIGIGDQMRQLCPGQAIALIKYATSGTSLEIDWRPGANAADIGNFGPSFNGFVSTVNNGLAALTAQGWQPLIHGMCWQQGEQDAKDGLNVPESDTSADDYGANLAHFVARVREQFASHAASGGIRFVPGQILPYAPPGGDVVTRFPGRDLVRQAILDADENSGARLSIANTRSVPTNSTTHPVHEQDGGGNTDEVHLNATAQLALGRSMANGMLDLNPQSYLEWSAERALAGGADEDDDHDGLSNREEYLLGGDPKDATNTPRPFLGFAAGNKPSYTLSRNLEASGFTPEVEFSPDLDDWHTYRPIFVSTVKQPGGIAILTFHGPWSLDDPAHSRGFFRTRLSGP